MFSDDKDFEEIYKSLTPGLVIAACTPKSLVALRSFFFSPKGAAIRRGSDVMLYRNLGTPIDWEAVFMQMKEQYSMGVRVFVVNRFEDNSTAAVVAHLHSKPALDVGDGSINPDFAGILREEFQDSKLIVTTPCKQGIPDSASERRSTLWQRTGDVHFN
jgi:hypothetical protein